MKAGNGDRTLSLLATSYATERRRVDRAYRRMRDISTTPHSPAPAREAARELSLALRDATRVATRARLAAACTTAQPFPPGHARHPKADRSVPPAVRPWSAELRRLTDIRVWLRRTTLDDKGVRLPNAVRVANYAAKGPHIAGLDFGNQAASRPGGPLIGINLRETVDGTTSARPARLQPVVAAASAKQTART
jgi:hypothetical protein